MAKNFQLFECYAKNVLIFNKLVVYFKTIFIANGFCNGQTEASGVGILALFVEGLEDGFFVQRFGDSCVADA